MARALRVHIPGGFYHVTLRGNHQQPVFYSAADRDLLDGIVGEAVEKSGLRIHAYCWMTNHLHLLAQVSVNPLGRAIHRIASRYARSVQRRLETTGHLFERRYHCVIVDADGYLLTLLRYIHRNPVKAGMVKDPLEYRWSSHRNYLGLPGQPWVTTNFGLSLLGATHDRAIVRYRELVGSALEDDQDSNELPLNPHYKDVLGSDEFAARIFPGERKSPSQWTLDALIMDCSRIFNLTEEQLASPTKSRSLTKARAWLARETVAAGITTVSALARRLNRSEGSLRQLLLRYP